MSSRASGQTRLRRIALAAAVVTFAVSAAAPAEARMAKSAKSSFSLGGIPCKAIAVPAAAPFAAGSCPGVRPGAVVNTPKGSCTLNFVFSGSDGRRYIGTAGHCILGTQLTTGENAGERAWAPGQGPGVSDSTGRRIGEFAYAVLQDPRDFALIRIDNHIASDPQLCNFGGPTGLNSDVNGNWTYLQHYGNGLAYSAVAPARTEIAFGMPDPNYVLATGLAMVGDSGAGVITTDGRAVGVMVSTGLHSRGGATGTIGITRVGPQVARASQVLGRSLTLQHAPLL